jgi:crotonobetainyl-CoA:carnitine CoA-transferase CaiB-like acyl-CoA transferase
MSGLLSGIRVVDLSRAIAGPYGSMVLADLGAEVIKIEQPEGDLSRFPTGPNYGGESYYYLAFNRNKKDLILDLGTPSGKKALYDLVRKSDVVWDNYRVGLLEELGAAYETLKKVNPKIICCSITGYGSSGPYSGRLSYDVLVQALTGMLSITGEPDGPPSKVGIALGDVIAGLFGVIGVLAALNWRNQTREGSKIEVPMLDSVISTMGYHFSYYFCSGVVPGRMGTQHLGLLPYGLYKARDGYIALGPCWPRICRAINAEWLADDPRFKNLDERLKNRKEFVAILEERLSHADVDDWVNIFEAEDIGAAPVNTIDKAAEDPQVLHNQMILSLKHPLGGEVKLTGNPIKCEHLSQEEYTPPPVLGQNTREILVDLLGYSEEEIGRLKQEAEERTGVRKATRNV